MLLCLALRDPTGAQEELDVAVVPGSLEHPAIAQQVNAAVADVGPIGALALYQADGAGRTGPDLRREPLAELDHRLVCPSDGEVQEALGIEHRAARLPELRHHRANRHLGGMGSVGMASHPVHDGEQRRVAIHGDRYAVLVFFTITEEAQVGVLDLQGALRHAGCHVHCDDVYSTRAVSA